MTGGSSAFAEGTFFWLSEEVASDRRSGTTAGIGGSAAHSLGHRSSSTFAALAGLTEMRECALRKTGA
jgi:hypothetical protein